MTLTTLLNFFIFAFIIRGLNFLYINKKKEVIVTIFTILNIYIVYKIYHDVNGLKHRLTIYSFIIYGLSAWGYYKYILFKNINPYIKIFSPLFFLVIYKIYVGFDNPPHIVLIGISYLTFKLSYLAYEINCNRLKHVNFKEYIFFLFFFPTITMGPINRYSTFTRNLPANLNITNFFKVESPYNTLIRLAVGILKITLLANFFNQFSFSYMGQFIGNQYSIGEFILSSFGYYFYLYCNFSGYIDIMIVLAYIAGFNLDENFDRPLFARNIRVFWTKWHITLGNFVKDILFTPLSTYLCRKFNIKYHIHLIALSIIAVFLIVGLWHGNGINFALFGLWHGMGLAIFNYYAHFAKIYFPNFARFTLKSRLIKIFMIIFTQIYVAISFFFFENSFDEILIILKQLTL